MELISCGCGCGEQIPKFDRWGRPRSYVKGHVDKGGKRERITGDKHWNWKGGRMNHRSGYILIYSPDHPFRSKLGYVMEHRLVLEKKLGRYLKKGEIPHHINGIKYDNRPENIELVTHDQHMKIHNTGNQYNKKDFSDRRCVKCGSDRTYRNKQGYEEWRKINEGFLCKKCYMKKYDMTRPPRKPKDLAGKVFS